MARAPPPLLGVRATAGLAARPHKRAEPSPSRARAPPHAQSQTPPPDPAGDRAAWAPPPPLTSKSGRLPLSQSQVSTPLRSPRSPLSVLHLTRAPTRPEPRGLEGPGAGSCTWGVPVRSKLQAGGWKR
jgi:hypothetical protein